MRNVREVLRLALGQGLSVRDVAASVGIARSTVSDHLRRAEEAGLRWPLPDELSDSALEQLLFPKPLPAPVSRPMPDWKAVHKELRRKGMTLALLWLEYRQSHPEGYGYSQFCYHYQQFCSTVDVVMRQEHRAGDKCFVDFPGQTLSIYDRRTGAVLLEAELFVAVLGASNYLYAEAVRSQDLPSWIGAHVHAFSFFGAVPRIVVCDNLRSGVTKSHRYEPDINATYQEMADHYAMAVMPARAYKPKDKAKAEAGVLLAERWILARLRNRRFYSLHEANQAIRKLVTEINDRPFKKLSGTRRSLYEELERPAMKPLPDRPYEFAAWKLGLKVPPNYHVCYEGHFYSVPYQLLGRRVDVRATAQVVEVFCAHERVCSHMRSYKSGEYTTLPAHMPEKHRRLAEWTPERLVAWAKNTGPSTAELIEAIMASRSHPEQGFRSCFGIMRLAAKHGQARMEAAATRALSARAYSYKSVESILRHNLDSQPLPAPRTTRPHRTHDNLRGPSYYK
jgi:transposase